MNLESYLRQLEEKAKKKGLRKRSIIGIKNKMQILDRYFPDTRIEDVTLPQLQEFINKRVKSDKRAYNTIGIEIWSFKFFYNDVLNKNYDFSLLKNPASKLRNKEDYFTKEEISRLFDAAINLRDKLFLMLMYHFELDVSDIVNFKVNSLTRPLDGGMILWTEQKRPLKLPSLLCRDLEDYLANKKPTTWLFEYNKGQQLSIATVMQAFKKTVKRSGIHKNLTSRYLTRSHAEHVRQYLFNELLTPVSTKIVENYIDPKLIDELKVIQSEEFDLRKLVCLCEELNGCFTNGWLYAASILQRAIIDHVPPIFKCQNFASVVDNYPWGRSLKSQVKQLENFARTTADNAAHGQIRKSEVLLIPAQLDCKIPMSTLLAEIIRILR